MRMEAKEGEGAWHVNIGQREEQVQRPWVRWGRVGLGSGGAQVIGVSWAVVRTLPQPWCIFLIHSPRVLCLHCNVGFSLASLTSPVTRIIWICYYQQQ